MTKVDNRNFIAIQGWMVNDLGLKGNELLVYAIIHGFSQAEGQKFEGSLQYLADWTNSSKQGIQKNLKSLIDKGLIEKTSRTVQGNNIVAYYTTELHGGYTTELHGGIQLSCTNNIDKNIDIDNIGATKKMKKPTIEEIEAYCKERKNNVDPQKFFDYYESNGWKVGKNPMKDFKACIRTWERNNFQSPKKAQTVPDYMATEQPKEKVKRW